MAEQPGAELQMITAVAAAMKLSSKVEVAALREVLLPCLLCSAVYKNNFDIVESCHQEHADLSAGTARHSPECGVTAAAQVTTTCGPRSTSPRRRATWPWRSSCWSEAPSCTRRQARTFTPDDLTTDY